MAMTETCETEAVQLDTALCRALRTLAQAEGCEPRALVAEAVTRLLEERQARQARPEVMAAYQASHERFGALYEKLAR
jgi:hypothetical protein